MSQKNRGAKVLSLAAGALLLASVGFSNVMAQGYTYKMTTQGSTTTSLNGQKVTFQHMDWNYTGGEPTWDGRPYRQFGVDASTMNNGSNWLKIISLNNGSGDPTLYFNDNGTVRLLADDQNGNRNFRTVVHFNGPISQVLTNLYCMHWAGTDQTSAYAVQVQVFNSDPGETGCNYLEIYSNGTRVINPK